MAIESNFRREYIYQSEIRLQKETPNQIFLRKGSYVTKRNHKKIIEKEYKRLTKGTLYCSKKIIY